MNSTIESLQAEITTLKSRINTLEQEKLVATSNVSDLVEALDTIRQTAGQAIKS